MLSNLFSLCCLFALLTDNDRDDLTGASPCNCAVTFFCWLLFAGVLARLHDNMAQGAKVFVVLLPHQVVLRLRAPSVGKDSCQQHIMLVS